jgi:hypothetical protein
MATTLPAPTGDLTTPCAPGLGSFRLLWATVRRPSFGIVLIGLAVYLGAARWVSRGIDCKRPLTHDDFATLGGLWMFVWFAATVYAPWRMYQGSRLAGTLTKRGFALRGRARAGAIPSGGVTSSASLSPCSPSARSGWPV